MPFVFADEGVEIPFQPIFEFFVAIGGGAFVAAEILVSALYDSGHRSRNAAETAKAKEGIDFITVPPG